MSAKIDISKFENLGHRELDAYLLEVLRKGVGDDAFVHEVSRRASSWDEHRLAWAIRLLLEISSVDAYHEISNHLLHPSANVRLGAMNAIRELKVVDEYVMMRVVDAMSKLVDRSDRHYLKAVSKRPANADAKRIADECSATMKSKRLRLGVRRIFGKKTH